MHLPVNRRLAAAVTSDPRRQFLTLRVLAPHDRLDVGVMRTVLAGAPGVETIEVDAERSRVWVFGNGAVDARHLLGALARWGYGARVLNHERNLPG